MLPFVSNFTTEGAQSLLQVDYTNVKHKAHAYKFFQAGLIIVDIQIQLQKTMILMDRGRKTGSVLISVICGVYIGLCSYISSGSMFVPSKQRNCKYT